MEKDRVEILNLEAIMLNAKLTDLRSKANKWFASNRRPQLLYLYSYIAGKSVTDQQYAGIKDVALSQIRGSLNPGRCRDFDGNFQLRNKQGQARLTSVARAWQRKSLTPISLVQVDDIYFVQDGHHRVSVALANQREQIKAKVTIMQVESLPVASMQLAHA